jgi:hypothetical protein
MDGFSDTADLPESLAKIIDAIGETATLAMVEAFGGTTQRLPALRNVTTHHFVPVIGEVLLYGLVRAIGGSQDVYIPKCADWLRNKRDRGMVRDYLAGVKVEALARQHNLSDRHIWRILKETDMRDDRQESLF